MASCRLQHGFRTYVLVSSDGRTRAEIVPELGGIVSSLTLPGPAGPRECLFRQPWFWDSATEETRGGIPLLFPVCGRLEKDGESDAYAIDCRRFRLPIHGFAMRMPWSVAEDSAADTLRLRIEDSEATRRQYPFSFRLELRFTAANAGLCCALTVANAGDRPMPYYAGFHPYFATPPGGGKAQTRYRASARARLLYNDAKTHVVGFAAPPDFPLSAAADVNALLLETAEDNATVLRFPDGFAIRTGASALFRYRQLYTLPDQPFFCDEPWMAPPGSFRRAGAARILSPGQSESAELHIAANAG